MLTGLTGGIGCGKSSVLNIFSKLGLQTIDADSICHELYNDKDSGIYIKMYSRWGDNILFKNKEIDRKAVAKLVFSDFTEREWLNSILHPVVLTKGLEFYNLLNNKNTVFDVPLLYEAGWDNHFNNIIGVWTDPGIRKKRLKKRGMHEDDIIKREKSQYPPEFKIEKADYVLINNGTFEQLYEQCQILKDKIYKEIKDDRKK